VSIFNVIKKTRTLKPKKQDKKPEQEKTQKPKDRKAKEARKPRSKPGKRNDKCVWQVSESCEGDVKNEAVFDNQLSIPMCRKHLKEHKEIMTLAQFGDDIECILDKTQEERQHRIEKKRLDLTDKV
jgi:hypothetical protein